MFMLFLIIIPKISAQSGYRIALSASTTYTEKLWQVTTLVHAQFDIVVKCFIQEMIDLPKPKNSITLYINDQDTESKAFSKSTESSNPGILFSSVYYIIS